MTEDQAKNMGQAIPQIKDTALALATIQAFRDMLDVMEEFIRNTEMEQQEGGNSE
jgi:hypothetical protein